jgi:hypothetical protein
MTARGGEANAKREWEEEVSAAYVRKSRKATAVAYCRSFVQVAYSTGSLLCTGRLRFRLQTYLGFSTFIKLFF